MEIKRNIEKIGTSNFLNHIEKTVPLCGYKRKSSGIFLKINYF